MNGCLIGARVGRLILCLRTPLRWHIASRSQRTKSEKSEKSEKKERTRKMEEWMRPATRHSDSASECDAPWQECCKDERDFGARIVLALAFFLSPLLFLFFPFLFFSHLSSAARSSAPNVAAMPLLPYLSLFILIYPRRLPLMRLVLLRAVRAPLSAQTVHIALQALVSMGKRSARLGGTRCDCVASRRLGALISFSLYSRGAQ